MPTRIQVTAFLAVVGALWAASLAATGLGLPLRAVTTLGGIVSAACILLAVFDYWGWRWMPVWFTRRPDIRGTWEVTMQSSWIDPSTGIQVQPIHGYMVIHQTYYDLNLRLFTAESSSELIGSSLVQAPDGTFTITGVYRNEPKLEVQTRSRTHYGALLLQVESVDQEPVQQLAGHYWTDRDTKGVIKLVGRLLRFPRSYGQASELFGRGS